MTVTQDQQIALDFFAVWEQQVKYFGLSILAEREDRLLFRKGKKLMEAALTVKPETSSADTKWTAEEYDALALAYFTHGADEWACLADFRKYSERHTDNAIRLAVNSCKYLDQDLNYAKGLSDYSNGLLSALQSLDSKRFKGRR